MIDFKTLRAGLNLPFCVEICRFLLKWDWFLFLTYFKVLIFLKKSLSLGDAHYYLSSFVSVSQVATNRLFKNDVTIISHAQ